jgi:hypothetical protein
VDRGFVLGRISDADHVLVDGVVQVGIRYPSPTRSLTRRSCTLKADMIPFKSDGLVGWKAGRVLSGGGHPQKTFAPEFWIALAVDISGIDSRSK